MCGERGYKTLCSFWADVDVLRAIDQEAERQDTSRSAILRRLMRVYVEVRSDANRKAEYITNKLMERMEAATDPETQRLRGASPIPDEAPVADQPTVTST